MRSLRLMRSAFAGALAVCLLALWAPAAAADDAADIRALLEAQTAAFTAGDADRAFGFASPNIQARFGDAETFLLMVESGYGALIGPSAYRVEEIELRGDKGAASAHVVGKDGRIYKAVYPLARLPSGEWRIDGCFLEQGKGRMS
jgi:hypothetical protein